VCNGESLGLNGACGEPEAIERVFGEADEGLRLPRVRSILVADEGRFETLMLALLDSPVVDSASDVVVVRLDSDSLTDFMVLIIDARGIVFTA
jgi:hypothetical protein